MKKRIICIILTVILSFSLLSSLTFAAANSGLCGDNGNNMIWTFNSTTGLLKITGSGRMANYSYTDGTFAPWRELKDKIITVDVQTGIEYIGEYAFFECSKLTSVNIPETVTALGKDVFKSCTSLKTYTSSAGITEISRHLFHDCTRLEKVILRKSITTIHANAFENCPKLTILEYAGSDEDWEKINFIKDGSRGLMYFNPKLHVEFKGGHKHNITNFEYNQDASCTRNGTHTGTCDYQYCQAEVTEEKPDSMLPHWFTYFIYHNDESYTSDGTETGLCMYGCQTELTRYKKNTKLIDSAKIFKDIKSSKWYTPFIDFAVGRKYFNGTSETMFSPEAQMTRGMFVTALMRMAGDSKELNAELSKATKFTDVSISKYYYEAVRWASANGIVNGITDTEFGPDNLINREQICTMLVRLADRMGILIDSNNESVTFTDNSDIGRFAVNYVYLCQRAGIVNGYDDGSFKPKKNATRAEVAKILTIFTKECLNVSYE